MGAEACGSDGGAGGTLTRGQVGKPAPRKSAAAADALTAYVGLLEHGESPAAACEQLGLGRDAVREAIRAEGALRERAAAVYAILSENVLAALYRAAVEGNVTAQSLWLKLHPPAGWGAAREETPGPATFDSVLNGLSDDELDELARAVGGGLPDAGP